MPREFANQEAAAAYVSTLKLSRAHEEDRRSLRRKKRNEYISRLQEELDAAHSQSLRQHIFAPSSARSEMEGHLVGFVMKTTLWWGTLCEQSIEQRLRYEQAVADQKELRQEYLLNVQDRENHQYQAVCQSEARRWETMQSEFTRYSQELSKAAVTNAVNRIIECTESCVEVIDEFSIDRSSESWLAQSAFQRITHPSNQRRPTDVFKAIFGTENPSSLTSIHFKELVDYCFEILDADKRATYDFDACAVPVIMLDGPKQSGKTLLADSLEEKFKLCRFNDRSLIQKALSLGVSKTADASTTVLNQTKRASIFSSASSKGGEKNLTSGPLHMVRPGDSADERPHGLDDEDLFSHKSLDERVATTTGASSTASANSVRSVVTSDAFGAEGQPEAGMVSVGADGPGEEDPASEVFSADGAVSTSLVKNSLMDSKGSVFAGQWAEMGVLIHDKLYRGESIDSSIIARLFALQLRELSADTCNGAIFEGILNNASEIEHLLNALVPKRVNKYSEVHRLWCEGLESYRMEVEARKREEAEVAAAAAEEAAVAAAAAIAAAEAEEHAKSPRKKGAGSRASMASPSLEEVRAPPSPPPEMPSVLAVLRVKLDEPAKKEFRSKGAKRGVDLSQLPAPELPLVEDISDIVKSEELFVSRTLAELEAYTGLLSCVLYVSCSQEEIFKRYAGLRIDSRTSEQYHLLYNPPPPERIPHLIGCDRTTSFSSELYNIVFYQKQLWEDLRRWFSKQPSLSQRVHEIEGDQSMEAISSEAEEVLRNAMDMYRVGRQLYDGMLDARHRIEELKKKRSEQQANREAERLRLIELYTEKGVPLPPELEQPGDVGSWCSVPVEVPTMILKSVHNFHGAYNQTYTDAWEQFETLSCMLLEYRRTARAQMKKFWSLPDDKQITLDQFLRQYNAVPVKLRCKPACKEELHLLTDEVSSALFALVEAKKKDAAAVIDHTTRRDAYLDGWEANICNVGALLVQQEVERFTMIVNLTMLYYSAAQEETVMFEEVDTEVTLIRSLEAGDLAGSGKNKADKRSMTSRKAHGRAADENGESSILEAFVETAQRLTGNITSLTDKFKMKVAADASGRGQKKVTLRSLKLAAITASCCPFLESEQATALERIAAVRRFVSELSRQGEAYVQSVKQEMMGEAKEMLVRQASAVNSAIFHIRCAIEEEDSVSPMHLGCGTFSLLQPKPEHRVADLTAPSFLTDVPLYAQPADHSILIHDTLNAARLMELIHRFRCTAPRYQLCLDGYSVAVDENDFAGGVKEGDLLLSSSEVFRLFDPLGSGALDWRELIVHLLFWCCQPGPKGVESNYIPEVTIAELRAMRDFLGTEPVTEERFRECPFSFDQYLKRDRRDVFVRALWYTFLRPGASTVDPFELLCFLCIDSQPIRGAQKAFSIFGTHSDMMTMSSLEKVLHIRATNPRALAMNDPFSKPVLYSLMAGRSVVSFATVCGCAVGRCILNQFDFMKRKRFICETA